ncbi:MAG: quercetin 2,3-dioxygenase [Verrucomicrobiia bacterium Tous-C2TDCM]|nr:MAG: quercetin 2,3-dioxygenase [Verrucomicrobiae bacterium Tous-C2TDCM]
MSSSTSIKLRPAAERGHADHGWLDTWHSFSFANYQNPDQMGFRSLRVINQDRIAPGAGFGTHPHRDMEIFSYILEGTLKHADSMGNSRELRSGQIQLMSAGSGVTHSEFNPSHEEGTHILQIWIQPHTKGLAPTYTEWHPQEGPASPKTLLISPDGRERSATIRQDASVYRLLLQPGEAVSHTLTEGRGLWVQAIRGDLLLNHAKLLPGDGASAETAGSYHFTAGNEPGEALLFDLA